MRIQLIDREKNCIRKFIKQIKKLIYNRWKPPKVERFFKSAFMKLKGCKSRFPYGFLIDFTTLLVSLSMLLDSGFLIGEALQIV